MCHTSSPALSSMCGNQNCTGITAVRRSDSQPLLRREVIYIEQYMTFFTLHTVQLNLHVAPALRLEPRTTVLETVVFPFKTMLVCLPVFPGCQVTSRSVRLEQRQQRRPYRTYVLNHSLRLCLRPESNR